MIDGHDQRRLTRELRETFSTSLAASTSTTPSSRCGTFEGCWAASWGVACLEMAAGREAARAAAIEVISDGLFFFEWVQSRLYAGVFKRTMGWKPSKVGGVFGVLLCATGGPYQFAPVWHFFFLGLGNEF